MKTRLLIIIGMVFSTSFVLFPAYAVETFDGEEILYDEIRANSQNRTLEIHFTNDSKRLEIIGTCLI